MRGDFWSRRRAAVAKELRAEEAAMIAVEEAEREAAVAETSDEDLLAEAGFGVPEELESAEDVREFLASALPQRLKTRALRRLWRLNPVLANVDGLVDYGGDFTDRANVVENLQTAYQVGKGMLRHVEEMARQAEDSATPESVSDAEPEDNTEMQDPAPVAGAETETFPAEVVEVEAPPAPRRRMTFSFDDQRTA